MKVLKKFCQERGGARSRDVPLRLQNFRRSEFLLINSQAVSAGPKVKSLDNSAKIISGCKVWKSRLEILQICWSGPDPRALNERWVVIW